MAVQSMSHAGEQYCVCFAPPFNVEMDTAIELGYHVSRSITSEDRPVRFECPGEIVRPLPIRGQTIGILDQNWAITKPTTRPEQGGVARLLPGGVKALVACGLVVADESFGDTGEYVLVADHVNFMGDSPLVGRGICFPDMSETYPKGLQVVARDVAAKQGMELREATLVALPDPSHPPVWCETLSSCVFGSELATMALAAAGDSVPTLGIVMIDSSDMEGRSRAESQEARAARMLAFAQFGLDCAARISEEFNRVQ